LIIFPVGESNMADTEQQKRAAALLRVRAMVAVRMAAEAAEKAAVDKKVAELQKGGK
jgi:hypothetical protein